MVGRFSASHGRSGLAPCASRLTLVTAITSATSLGTACVSNTTNGDHSGASANETSNETDTSASRSTTSTAEASGKDEGSSSHTSRQTPPDAGPLQADASANPTNDGGPTSLEPLVDSAADPGDGGDDQGEAAPSSNVDAGSALALLEQARADYRSWQTRTEMPVSISAEIFSLCRPPSVLEEAFVESVHSELALLDWLNPRAEDAMAVFESTARLAEPREFPVGATIVKEKLAHAKVGYELAALGLMIKREPGFNPSYGDWQFGYWDTTNGLTAGSDEQAYCGDCHAFADTDFVYVDDSWRRP